MLVAALACWLPLWFMVIVASHDSATATTFPPPLLPGPHLAENVGSVLSALALGRAFANSIVVSACVAVGGALMCAAAGFAFAKLEFRGRSLLFALVLLGLTMPVQLAVIPSYLLVSALGWVDSLKALIVPGLASAFGVFWMRQHIAVALPDELLDAAALDGCGPWRSFWRVAFPLARPGAAVLAGILFVSAWSDFMWPFIVLRSPGSHTVQVALRALQGEYGVEYARVFAGALIATVPMVLLLLIAGRWATRGALPYRPRPFRRRPLSRRSAMPMPRDRRPGRRSHDEPGARYRIGLGLSVAGGAQQDRHGELGELVDRGRDRSERRRVVRGVDVILETHDADIGRHTDAALPKPSDRAQGE